MLLLCVLLSAEGLTLLLLCCYVCCCQLKADEIVAPDESYSSDFMTLLPPHPTAQLVVEDRLSVEYQRKHIDELHRIAHT